MLLAPTLNGVGSLAMQGKQTCSMKTCSVKVNVHSCCDEVVGEEVCPMTGEIECQCGIGKSDLPKPGPTPPLPLRIGDLMIAIPESVELLCMSLSLDESDPIATLFERFLVAPTHNTAQAILGNWQI